MSVPKTEKSALIRRCLVFMLILETVVISFYSCDVKNYFKFTQKDLSDFQGFIKVLVGHTHTCLSVILSLVKKKLVVNLW